MEDLCCYTWHNLKTVNIKKLLFLAEFIVNYLQGKLLPFDIALFVSQKQTIFENFSWFSCISKLGIYYFMSQRLTGTDEGGNRFRTRVKWLSKVIRISKELLEFWLEPTIPKWELKLPKIPASDSNKKKLGKRGTELFSPKCPNLKCPKYMRNGIHNDQNGN